MSETLTIKVHKGDMPRNPYRASGRSGGRFDPVFDELKKNPDGYLCIGPFGSKSLTLAARNSICSSARKRGVSISTSVMPDHTLNVKLA